MSVYSEVETEFTDLNLLQAALEQAGLADRVKVYGNADGIYRKWSSSGDPFKGQVRGKDASLVVHGGLDSKYDCCGDTAFVLDSETGRYRALIDVAHGNAQANWVAVKDNYAAAMVEKVAKQHGLRYERTTNAQGKTVIRVYQQAEGTQVLRRRATVRG